MKTQTSSFDYRRELRRMLAERQARNSSYSLRAFARDLGLSSTAVCDVLQGHRHLSRRNVLHLIDYLGWSPLQAQETLDRITGKADFEPSSDEVLQLDDDLFRFIAEWYYLAILNLAKLPDNQGTADWVAQRLAISQDEAQEALDRLQRLGYLDLDEEGRLQRKIPPVHTTQGVPSPAIRKYHRQILQKAADALDTVPMDSREVSVVAMPVNMQLLPEAKRRIFAFKEEMARFLAKGEISEVYTLSMQLIPQTQLRRREEKK